MVPSIGLAGEFKVKDPFTLEEDMAYICRGISYIQSLVEKGVDVFNMYYVPAGLVEQDFADDIANNVAIITLKDENDVAVNIPDSYIEAVPYDVEVPYQRFAVLMSIGSLPESTDLTPLLDKITEEARTTIGVVPQAEIALLPKIGFVTKEQHAERELQRETNIKYDKSPKLLIQDLQQEIENYKTRIADLEDIIIKQSNIIANS